MRIAWAELLGLAIGMASILVSYALGYHYSLLGIESARWGMVMTIIIFFASFLFGKYRGTAG